HTYTKPIPADAVIVNVKVRVKGVTVKVPHARFRDRGGELITAPLTKDGKRVRMTVKKKYGTFKDPSGRTKHVPLFADAEASQQRLAELVRKAERSATGLGDAFEEHHKRPLTEHVADFRRHLEAEGDCPEHVRKTCAQIQAILDGCGFVFIADLDAEK